MKFNKRYQEIMEGFKGPSKNAIDTRVLSLVRKNFPDINLDELSKLERNVNRRGNTTFLSNYPLVNISQQDDLNRWNTKMGYVIRKNQHGFELRSNGYDTGNGYQLKLGTFDTEEEAIEKMEKHWPKRQRSWAHRFIRRQWYNRQ